MLRNIYAQKALSQIPRILGNMDRNPYSPTYGCMHRDYWLDKTSDFPDAVRQFGVHAFALIYKHNFPENIYYRKEKIRDWAIAAMNFWTNIQHKDGSFDEFYPNERGWVGPSAFTTYSIIETYNLLSDSIPDEIRERVLKSIERAAFFIAKGDKENDNLANHHAMACLALWKSYKLLNNRKIADAYQNSLRIFNKYYINHEGWSIEYDGIDAGYLSATVSFLGKIYKDNKSPEIRKIIEQSVQMCSYFIYPNGFYGGSLGSRNTLHFYPHGFEIIGKKYPLAIAAAEKMLLSLSEGKLVPPEIISDRYVVYRVPEYLLSYIDYCRRPKKLPKVPYERNDFEKYFKKAGIYINKTSDRYLIANLAKGGVIKYFNTQNNSLILNDCGIIGTLDNRKTVTTQWVDPKYKIKVKKDNVSVFGQMNYIPAFKLFNPIKNILFRLTLIVFGWNSTFSHLLKGWIRNILITSDKKVPIHFRRSFKVSKNQLALSDEVTWSLDVKFKSLSIGDEFFIRHVPQSRYFQSQELDIAGLVIDSRSLDTINDSKCYTRKMTLR